jgi:hypothetical protein
MAYRRNGGVENEMKGGVNDVACRHQSVAKACASYRAAQRSSRNSSGGVKIKTSGVSEKKISKHG